MLKEERQLQVLDYIKTNQFTTIHDLCQLTSVSPSTIRRDLSDLINAGLIISDRNGVRIHIDSYAEGNLQYRSAVYADAKARLAIKAAELIPDNSIIFLDSSSTVLHMVKLIQQKKNITIVTHSLAIVSHFINSHFPIYLLGGNYFAPSQAFYGESTIAALDNFNFDFAFFSCVTLTEDGYATTTWEHSASLRRHVIQRTNSPVLLCEQSKIGKYRPFNFAHINNMKYVITNSPQELPYTRSNIIYIE